MLTALGAETDRVVGLELGRRRLRHQAVQPARAGAAGRARCCGGPASAASPRRAGSSTATSSSTRPATRPARTVAPLALTAREFDLLRFLVAHPRHGLLPRGAAPAGLGLVVRRPVHGHRARAPAAREGRDRPDDARPGCVTVWGVGYRWEPADDQRPSDPPDRRRRRSAGAGRRRPRRAPGGWLPAAGRSAGSPPWSAVDRRGGRPRRHRRHRPRDVHLRPRLRGGALVVAGRRRGRDRVVSNARRRGARALVAVAAERRPSVRRRAASSSPAPRARRSSRSSPTSWHRPAQRLAGVPRTARRGSRSRAASWSRGCPTTCARRWPGCGR